eukprot:Em0001g1601a
MDGPLFKQLNVALQSFNVDRQSYYGSAFIGDHVHKALQPKNIETLCNSLTKVVMNDEPSLTTAILKTSEKFQNILEMFATCHKLYDSSFLSGNSIQQLMSYNSEHDNQQEPILKQKQI